MSTCHLSGRQNAFPRGQIVQQRGRPCFPQHRNAGIGCAVFVHFGIIAPEATRVSRHFQRRAEGHHFSWPCGHFMRFSHRWAVSVSEASANASNSCLFDALTAASGNRWERMRYCNLAHNGTFYPPGMKTVPKRAAIVWANPHCQQSKELLEYARSREKRGWISIQIWSEPEQNQFWPIHICFGV